MLQKTFTSIKVNTNQYILVCMTALLILNVAIYTLYSLRLNLTVLEYKSQSHLTLLNHYLENPDDKNDFQRKRLEILDNNKELKAIDIYRFSQDLDVQSSHDISLFSLLNDSEYYVTRDIYNNHAEKKSGLLTTNKKFSGYIKLSIDLDYFRLQLIKNNLFLYLIVTLLHGLAAILFIIYFKKLHRPVLQLKNQSEIILNSDLEVVLESDNANIIDNEYKIIQSAFYSIVARYNVLVYEIESKNQQLEEYKQNKETVVNQRNDFQNLVTNELKTSLNAMTGGLQLLNQQYLSQEQQDALVILRKSNYQLNFMLDQIAQLNNIKKNKSSRNFVTFNPIQIISDLVVLFEDKATKKGINLISRISHIDYMLEGDIEKIRSILDALLDNAMKYTATGEVVIESSMQHFDETTRWIIKILDTGIGIDEVYFDDIFMPFFQVDNEINSVNNGIGVGLSIAKQLTELIDAELSVTSVGASKGSSFELYLTLFDKKQSVKRSILQNINICCLNESDADNVIHDLEKFGAYIFNVHDHNSFGDGYDVLNSEVLLINTSIDAKEIFTMVEKIRLSETNKRALIIWLLNEGDIVNENQAMAIGIDVILNSNIEVSELAETISKWLN